MSKYAGLLAVVAVLGLAGRARAVVLYDATGNATPESQGWLSYYSIGGTGVRTIAGGEMTYDATAQKGERGGVSNRTIVGSMVNGAFPALDRSTGFVVSADLRVVSEVHTTPDRSGVSLLVLSSDLMGVEIGMWGNEIWAQSGPTFTHAEGVAENTTLAGAGTAGNTRYDVSVLGGNYTLYADGVSVLSGALRDYSSFGFPYTLPNYIFVGDDSTSAGGAFELSRLAVAVPEPATMSVLGLTPLLLRRRKV